MEIRLEKFNFENPEEVHGLWSDKEATLFTNFPHLPSIEECQIHLIKMKNYYAQRNDHFGPFAIRSNDGAFLGLAGADAGDLNGEFQIWYFIHRKMWGKRVATSAVTSLISLMEASGVDSIKAETVVENSASWRFLERLGFKRTETLAGAHKKNGTAWDRYVYHR
jgi:RimJ/RimL family protein N-acetyltransferase